MYPKEMQTIVKNFYNNNEYSIREVAKIFNISKSTIQRWITSDNLSKKVKNDYKDKIDKIINDTVIDNPFITIKDIKNNLENKLNIKISLTGVFIHVKRNGFSFKKVSKRMYRNLNEIKIKVKEFRKIIKKIKLSDIVCLDESGIKENMCEDYGWSKKGKKIIKYTKSHPKKYSVMMTINKEKIISSKIYDKNINSEIFYNYMKDDLLPIIKNKYILMDNIPFHKSEKIGELVKGTTNKLLFIPPYCPDFNPIENVFHILKQKIRKNVENINSESIKNTIDNITTSFRNIYKKSFRKGYKFK